MANERYWTPDEKRILDEVESSLNSALSEARAKLAPLRAKLNNVEDGRPCFRCNCPDFVRLPGHTHSTTCARETCGHSIISHEL
jgi:hypothetical protein